MMDIVGYRPGVAVFFISDVYLSQHEPQIEEINRWI